MHTNLQTINETLAFNAGPVIMDALKSEDVLEIMVNPDNMLWIERFGKPMEPMGEVEPHKSRMVITMVAAALGTTATVENPIVEGELPLDGSRFEGLLPPIVSNPAYTIRKKASRVFTLEDYVTSGIMPVAVRIAVERAIVARRNILVVGGTGSGKTTLTNALIHALSELCPHDRLAIIEDTGELQCSSKNKVLLHTSDFVDMNRLLRACMRLRPDRMLVGEVRGGEALSLLKAWNTGHSGGFSTLHANSAVEGLTRLEQLISEATPAPMQTLIGQAVHMAIFVQKTPEGRKITELINVNGYNPQTHKYETEILYDAAA